MIRALQKYSLLLIVLLALGLRLVNINQSFWLDEAAQGQMSMRSYESLWFDRQADFHPPLFYLLAHFWMQFGTSESWLRLLPIGFGVANVVVMYLLGKKLFSNTRAGIIAAFLLAINSYHIYYSQEFRMYSLLALLGTWSMYLLLQRSRWLFVTMALLMYTHYSAMLLIFAQILYVVWFGRDKLRWFVVQLVLAAALFVPWVPQFSAQLASGSQIDAFIPGWRSVLTVPTLKSIPLIIFKFMAGRINIQPKVVYGIYIVFVLAVTALGIILAKQQRKALYTWLAVPILSSIFLSLLIPQTQPFRLLYTLPALVLLLTQACLKFPRLFLTLLIYISIVGNVLYFTRPRLQREQWRQAIGFLQSQDGSIVVKFSDPFAPFYWYDPSLRVQGVIKKYPGDMTSISNELTLGLLRNRVFMLEYLTDLTDPSRFTEKALTELGYVTTQAYNFEGVGIIHVYEKP